MNLHDYIREIASLCYDIYDDDYYAALNVAECICDSNRRNNVSDAAQVHAILEGEL